MKLESDILQKHKQLTAVSCIPMSVELVLKLTGSAPVDYYGQQTPWKNRTDGNFHEYNNRTLFGLRFTHKFNHTRDISFPLEDLFEAISNELKSGRFVIISLESSGGWHMYVIYEELHGEFSAVTKMHNQGDPVDIKDVKARVRAMQGTDILTYEPFLGTVRLQQPPKEQPKSA